MPNVHNLQVSERKARLWQQLGEYKLSCGCQMCGYNRCSEAMDFHHIDETTKRANVSDMVSSGYGLKTIMTEVQKCVILCKNCHAEETKYQKLRLPVILEAV
jgi:hypothetical protein